MASRRAVRRALAGAGGAAGAFGGFAAAHADEGPGASHPRSQLGRLVPDDRPVPTRFGESGSYTRMTPEGEFPDLTGNFSYMSVFLTPELYGKLAHKQTRNGFTLDQAIQPGVDVVGNPYSPHIGCFAGDEDSYYMFADLFEPILRQKHGVSPQPDDPQFLPQQSIGSLKNCSFSPQRVANVKIRVSRNLGNYPFSPSLRRHQRREVEFLILQAAQRLSGANRGVYHRLGGLADQDREQLVGEGIGFEKPTSPLLLASGAARDWPDARGVYLNEKRDFWMWVNEHDHLKMFVSLKGGDLRSCFARMVTALQDVEYALRTMNLVFVTHNTWGYLSPSLSNVGTGMEISLVVKLPKLAKHPEFKKLIQANGMQIRGDPSAAAGTVQLVTTTRMKLREAELCNATAEFVHRLIKYEEQLEIGLRLSNLA